MTPAVPASPIRKRIIYPDSDGQPVADNTLQFKWIHTIFGGVDGVFKDDPNVLVAGDLLWYPVEGEPTVRCAPRCSGRVRPTQGRTRFLQAVA